MIQRVQSIYLFVVLIILIYFSLGASIVSFHGTDIVYLLKSNGLVTSTANLPQADFASQYYFIGSVILALWCVVVAFAFRNLSLQITLARIGSFGYIIFLLIILSSIFIGSAITENPDVTLKNSSFGLGSYLLTIGFICYQLAIKGIKKDKKLIDSVDRIR